MRILIRHIRRTGNEGVERSEAPFQGDIVSIGRATDQVIQLQDRALPLAHSELRADGRNLAVKATGDDYFFADGKRSRSAKLAVGSAIEIGEYTITRVEAPADYEYAVEVEAGEVTEYEVSFGTGFKQGLEQTGLSKRGLAWALFFSILAGFLAIPSASLLDRDVAYMLRTLPVPDDGVWDSGPLHPSHQFMGDDCSACHVDAFTMTQDEQCVACHTSITHHVDVDVHAIPELEGQRCASCHKEHNEPSVLSRSDQALCADCHADLSEWTSAELSIDDAGDFEHHHPEFKASMLVGEGSAADYQWHIERVSLDDPAITEQSNLVFPHDTHMRAEGVDGPSGEVVMECSDCHRPEPGGAYMQPISMEQHCADCHLLTFDAAFPDRELPHGEPDLVVRLLEEFYARQALIADGAPPGHPVRVARRPGQASGPVAVDYDPDIDLVLSEAQRAASDIFERTSCKVCHVVDIVDDPDLYSRWQVRPVRIAQVWMPKAWFDHQAHAIEDCARCHDSEGSSLASDVSMPNIESCRDCHGGGEATNKLASNCVECHIFHLPGLDLMKPDVRGAVPPTTLSELDMMRPERLDQLTPVRAK